MTPETSTTPFLHVANGTSTTRTIEAAGLPGIRSIWADPLYEGPVPAGLSDDEMIDVRARYLGGDDDGPVDPVNDLRRWRSVIADSDAYQELVLWFEHDLFDQLNLIQLLDWLPSRLPPAKPVGLICIGAFPGRPAFKGLGELTATEVAPLLHTRQRVGDAQYSLAARAWRAFASPAPDGLEDLRAGNTTALPYLAAAVTRFLQEYPWTRDGLSRTERRLLELANGGTSLIAAFPRMHEGEDAYYVADLSLAALADALSEASPPLLARSAERDDRRPLHRDVSLTDFGRQVLAGRRDRIASCGIDKWLGGVHLTGDADLWRWDEESQKLRRS